jgi:hypothetical protein
LKMPELLPPRFICQSISCANLTLQSQE